MTEQYNELLTQLKQRNESTHVDIHIPSINETIAVKPLSVKQQAAIITGVMKAEKDTNIYSYQNIIDEIIINNMKPEDVARVLSFDRSSILIQYRLLTMGDTIEIDGNTHDLEHHVQRVNNIELDVDCLSKQVVHEGVSVQCNAVRLHDELIVNKQVPTLYKNTTDRDQVSNVFLIELAKYVSSVSFDDNLINFAELNLKQKIQICEMLPMSLSQLIVRFVEDLRSTESEYTTIDIGDDSVNIPVDSQLFDQ